ncbi:MAG: hypothetical protein LLG08_08695 [Actinomycetia bacterium]|nr:hypothetical protein [Actinomycetes bacterium]
MTGAGLARRTRSISALLAFVLVATPLLTALPAVAFAEEVSPETVPASDANGVPAGAVEDTALRTENSKQYRLPDGRITAVVSEAPIHHKDASGAWVDIDTTLVSDTVVPGSMRTRSAPVVASFGSESSGDAPVRVTASGHTVGLDMLAATEERPLTFGSFARYAGVAHDANLVYEAQDDGVKETIVLASADAPDSYRFFLDAGDLALRGDASVGWVLCEKDTGKPVFGLGGLSVFDSGENAAGDPAYCGDATMSVEPVSGGAYVSYSVPRAWLTDPARAYPVMIDPTLSAVSSLDTYVSSAYPTTNYNSSTELRCGYYDSTTGQNRSLVKFGVGVGLAPFLSTRPSDRRRQAADHIFSSNSIGLKYPSVECRRCGL